MLLTFRPIKVWPDDWKSAHARRPSSPFGAGYQRTLQDLDRELRHLGGSEPFLQVAVRDEDLRLDGQLRSSAVATHPGVILTFQTRTHARRSASSPREVGFGDSDHERITTAYRMAAKKHHPDNGGDPEMFRRLTAARDLLVAS